MFEIILVGILIISENMDIKYYLLKQINYILYKNYCINKDVNVTLINKRLDIEDKICTLKTVPFNRGNGMIFCENKEKSLIDFIGDKFNNIELTKLSRYYKYLFNKNLALIKIDVEGPEANVFEGGAELITKYHVPFIMMEFEYKMVETHRINALEFFQLFKNNGYKIALNDFFSKNYTTSLKLEKYKDSIELFIVYEKILE
jgi:FkbM family methyltransferase